MWEGAPPALQHPPQCCGLTCSYRAQVEFFPQHHCISDTQYNENHLMMIDLIGGGIIAVFSDGKRSHSMKIRVFSDDRSYFKTSAECQITTMCRIANNPTKNIRNVHCSCATHWRFFIFQQHWKFHTRYHARILYGVGKLELSVILESPIAKKFVNIGSCNTQLDTFYYGYTNASSKPRCLSRSHNRITWVYPQWQQRNGAIRTLAQTHGLFICFNN